MSRNLTTDQQAFVDVIRDFTSRETGSTAQRRALTQNGELRHHQGIYERLGGLGWIGVALDPEFGGSGGDQVDECIMLQELARGGAPIGGVIPSLIVAGIYEKFGSPTQQSERIPAIAAGEVHAIAMSEPHAGSDVAALTCGAARHGEEFVLNGQKTWISNAHFADWVLVVARTSTGEKKHDGLTMFEIPVGTSGMEIRTIPTMGEAEVNDVYLTDCIVPLSAVVGSVDQGWSQLVSGLERERLMMSSQLLGFAQRVLDRVREYVLTREQFGKRLAEQQVIRHKIADMAVEIEACEALVYAIAQKRVRDVATSFASETSMAKLKASEVLQHCALEGVQLMGGYGYASESEMEQDVKIGVAATIYGGTSEIQKEIIAKHLGLGR